VIPEEQTKRIWDFQIKNVKNMSLTQQQKTDAQYSEVINECKSLFLKKTQDYGTAWRVLRLPSVTDQIFIKANRIRSIQEAGTQKVGDSVRSEFVGIVNYAIIALIQLRIKKADVDLGLELKTDHVGLLYDEIVKGIIDLHHAKNHDYGEAWRDMRISSITDIILQKLLRVKQIEDNKGVTIASEGVSANYQDMVNYAVFCLIKMNEEVATTVQYAPDYSSTHSGT